MTQVAGQPVGGFLPAGTLHLDQALRAFGLTEATFAFASDGAGRLAVVLPGKLDEPTLETLGSLADLVANLRLRDLDAAADYPEQHASAFGLAEPLPAAAFNRSTELLVVTPPDRRRFPARVGGYGVRLLVRPGLAPPRPEPGRRRTPGRTIEDGFVRAGRLLVAWTRRPAATLCDVVLWLMISAFIVIFVHLDWTNHARFATYGFDVGIYDQATWLLSRFHPPFSTVNGLNVLGSDSPYVLLLLAPLYWVWANARLLLLLQVGFLALPALAVYKIGGRRLGHPVAGLAGAFAYLAYPGVQWAAVWQFHPETIGAGCLGLAALAAERRRTRWTAALLVLTALCGQAAILAVAGFGAMLWTGGQRSGRWVLAAALVWFTAVAFLLVPLVGGHHNLWLVQSYGVTGYGPFAAVAKLPAVLGRAVTTGAGNPGVGYLLLVFVPLLGLPLLSSRWLLAAAPVLVLNLASLSPYQQQIRYQYLALPAPMLAVGAMVGLAALARGRHRTIVATLLLLVLVAGAASWRYGASPWSKAAPAAPAAPATDAALQRAIDLIPPGAAVSADYNLVPQLSHRQWIYEWPNPLQAVNWGTAGAQHTPAELARLGYVVVDRADQSPQQLRLLDALQASPQWQTRYDSAGVVVLAHLGAPGVTPPPASPLG